MVIAAIVITVHHFGIDRTNAFAPANRHSNHYESWPNHIEPRRRTREDRRRRRGRPFAVLDVLGTRVGGTDERWPTDALAAAESSGNV